jgi:hypothetical protein
MRTSATGQTSAQVRDVMRRAGSNERRVRAAPAQITHGQQIQVLGVRGEAVRNAGHEMHDIRDGRRLVSEVSVNVSDTGATKCRRDEAGTPKFLPHCEGSARPERPRQRHNERLTIPARRSTEGFDVSL